MTLPRFDRTTILYVLSQREYPPHGGFIVWNGRGQGRLKSQAGPFSVPPPNAGALARQEVLLTLDGTPLIRRQMTECPTCPQLIQAGCGSIGTAHKLADVVNQLTVDMVKEGSETVVEALDPILSLLPRGYFLVALDDYYPTDGRGDFFWTASASLKECAAISWDPRISNRPTFLAPTQSTACFRRESVPAAEQSLGLRPGIALQLTDKMSVLLDGHHRGLAAARRHSPFPCITIAALWLNDDASCLTQEVIADFLRSDVDSAKDIGPSRNSELPQAVVDGLVESMQAVPWPPLPAEFVPANLSEAYPDLDAVIGRELIAGFNRPITDEQIDDIVSGRRAVDRHHGSLIFWLLQSLWGYHDPRVVEVAMRVSRSRDHLSDWVSAFAVLSRIRCNAVDDFFVEFLCSQDVELRPELKKIADDFFARRK